jgi:tRNA(fMet)-specific endonuclease VapC
MATRYLLDTNTASYAIKGNFPTVRENLRKIQMGHVFVSAVTEAELRFGVLRKGNPPKLATGLDAFLIAAEPLPWDSGAAIAYARLRTALEASGTPVGNLDLMIAAQAVSLAAVLVTHDSVFRRIPHLLVEDWVD